MKRQVKFLVVALFVVVTMIVTAFSASAAEPATEKLVYDSTVTDSAEVFLEKALEKALTGVNVEIELKKDMEFVASARYGVIEVKAASIPTTTITVKGGNTYGIVMGGTDMETTVAMYGQFVFDEITYKAVKESANSNALFFPEGCHGTFGHSDGTNHGGITTTSGARANLGGNVTVYTGAYATIAGNPYKNTIAIDSPTLIVRGNTAASYILGGSHNGNSLVTGKSIVKVLDAACATDVAGGGWYCGANGTGDAEVTVDSTATSFSTVVAGNIGSVQVAKNYTLNVANGGIKTVAAFRLNGGGTTGDNQVVVINITGGNINNFYGSLYRGSGSTGNNCVRGNVTVNVSGNPTFGTFYGGMFSTMPNSWDETVKTINISGGTFNGNTFMGSVFDGRGGHHDGKTTVVVSGGTFNKMFNGGSWLKVGADLGTAEHKGDIEITVTGGTFKASNSIVAGSNCVNVTDYEAISKHSGNTVLVIKGGTYSGHICAGTSLTALNSVHSGTSTLKLEGAFTHTGGRIIAGSLNDRPGSVHSGDTTLILSSNETASYVNEILGGSYIDGGTFTGNTNITITGSADWAKPIFGGSFIGAWRETIASVGGTETTPNTVNITVEDTYTGEVAKIVGGQRYNGSKGVNNTAYTKTNITIKGGDVASVYAHDTTSTTNKNVGETNIAVKDGFVMAIYGFSGVDTGATVKVNVEDAERVVRAWGSANESVTPANATITYNRAVIRDDEVKNWATATPVGAESAQPDVYMPTVFISANGTGDGSSPESPLGNDSDYTVASGTHKKNAFYKAFSELSAMGGRIVIVGEVRIDSAESRVEGSGKSPSEFVVPATGGEVIITSVYNGVDYRTKGAKLVLDQDACAVTFVAFNGPVTIDDVNIEHVYDRNDANSWGTPMVLAANGYKFVIGENVKVTAFDASKNLAGNWYPAIIGGHRFSNMTRNPDVTIKAGNWDFVAAGSFGMSTTYPGAVTGDATLKIEGGNIDSVLGTSSQVMPYASISGKLTIDITGGKVNALAIAAKNGATNEIVVNVAPTAERVAKITGGTSDSNIPENLTLTYDRSVTRDDEVKYVYPEQVTATGNVEDQPEPVVYRLYIANTERGLGDGSSPENAIGHAADYYETRAKALAIIAAHGGNNANVKDADQKAVLSSVVPKHALIKALNMMKSKGGELIVCESLTIDSTDAMRRSLADFFAPTGSEHILITSYDSSTGIDYRSKGVRFVLDVVDLGLCLELGSPTTFDHITIEHRYNSKNGKGVDNGALIAARANKLVIGYDVYVWANDINPDVDKRIDMYPSIVGGHRYNDAGKGLPDGAPTYVSICSGNWAMVVGGAYTPSKVPHTGNATISVDGTAKIETICGTTKATNGTATAILDGSVWIGLWGGEVDNVYVVGKPGLKWGDASIGLGGTKINGKVRATHPDYAGEEIQAWVFNYTDKQIDTDKIVGFESPVPATGSPIVYLGVVAVVSLAGAVALISTKKRKIKD